MAVDWVYMGTAVLKAVRLMLCYAALSLVACEEGPPAPERGHTAASEQSVSSAADMRVARAAHTATRLRGGRPFGERRTL